MLRIVKLRATIACMAMIAASCLTVRAHAQSDDPRSAYLIKLLEGSSQFRVRAQAAISLGAVASSGVVLDSLGNALRDVHPAVRAAAATSLGRMGDSSRIAALRPLERDPEDPVRSAAKAAIAKLSGAVAPAIVIEPTPTPTGPAQYYVAVALPASRVAGVDAASLASARNYIRDRVRQISGVVMAPEGESSDAANRELKRRSLRGFYIDSSIMSVEKKPDGGTRVAVSVILATYPGRDMRAIMQGAATVSGGGASDYEQAVQGAYSGALRQLPQALSR
jgi:HEAT repeats